MGASRTLKSGKGCEYRHEIGRPTSDRLLFIAKSFSCLQAKRGLRNVELLNSDRSILDQRRDKGAEDKSDGFAACRLKIHEAVFRVGVRNNTMTEAAGASSSSRGGLPA
jgi:hypothetical protein